ncbi:MAG: ATP-binding protein [Mariprofundus sp.]|nr:ATP-binding protein [Mariprofundus sp.]
MTETQNIEWKENWRDEYFKWICGYANAQGGKLFIGVNDGGVVLGINNAKELLEKLPNQVRQFLGILVDVNLLENNNKYSCSSIDFPSCPKVFIGHPRKLVP